MNTKLKKYLRKTIKIILWIIGSVIALFLLIVLLLQVPAVQNYVKDKAVSYLEKKIGTEVKITKIEIGLPKKVILEGVYFEGQNGDTLIAGDKLAVDISLMKLLSNEVEINSINLEGITANVSRNKDSVFNFDYIIKAFDSGKPKDTTGAPMKFSIEDINLDRIRVKFNDDISKNYVTANINHFDTSIKKFDLDKMDFEVPDINLDGLKVRLKQGMVDEIAMGTQKAAEEASKQPDLKLKLKNISLANINVGYDNEGSRLDTGIKLNKLLVEVNTVDLKTQLVDLDNLELNGLKGQLAFGKFEKQVQQALPKETAAVQQAQWKLKLNNAEIIDVAFKFDDQNSAPVAKGIDFKHLDISNLNLKAKELSYAPESISGKIEDFSMADKSGVNVAQLRTNFFYGPKGAELKDLYLETPNTLVKDQIVVGYPSLNAVSKNIGSLSVNANLDHSKIGFKDVLLFVPDLATTAPFKGNPNGTLYINSRVQGKVSDLYINNLEVRGIGTTVIAASGRIKGLPDAKTAYFDMNVRQFKSTAKDINTFLPPGTLPANFQLPAGISAKASFKGTLNSFSTNLDLASTFGNAKFKGMFDQSRKGHERYDGDVDIANFDVGKLLKNDSIGKITIKAKVKGTGLDPQTAVASLKGKVIKAEFNGYTYRDLMIDGKINKGQFDAVAKMDDPNLDFDLTAKGGFNGKYPNGKIKLNVDIADLNKLNLHAGPLKLRGNVDADIADANPDNLNGTVHLHSFMFVNEKEEFALDSVTLKAVTTPDKNLITLKSQIAHAKIEGKYKLTELPAALQYTIAKYYNTAATAPKKPAAPQQLSFDIRIDNDPVLYKLVPQITRLEPISLSGKFNSEGDTLIVHGAVPRLVYGANTISGITIDAEAKDTALVYSVKIEGVENEQFQLAGTTLAGDIKNNVVKYRLDIEDRKKKQQYMLAGKVEAKDGNTEIVLDPDGLMLDYIPWTIAQDNLIRFGENGLYANNFEMSNEGGAIKLQSESDTPNAPLNVELENFKIETITNMVQKEESKFHGTINGTANIKDLTTSPVFTADLTIADFAVSKDTVGEIKIQVNNNIADTYAANVSISGNNNQVNLEGNYNTAGSSFDMNLDIQKLTIASLQAFTFGALKEGKGDLNGNFKITGTITDPNVIGDLKFNDVAFRVTELNSYFKGINNNISFTDAGIEMNNFKVEDEKNNLLTIDGNIATTDYKAFGFNLNVKAANFRAINSTAKDNDFYYGDLFIDANLKIKGTMESPVIDGDLKINEDTKFSVVLPQQDPSIADREGIVEFVDEDNAEMMQRLKIEETVNSSQVKGMDVSVNIEIVKEAELNLIIDKGNGDFLQLKGEAQLNGGIDPSGKTTLTGRYEFSEGSYQMTFNFLKRKFDIEEGSYILWTGEPTDATINISAVYKTETPPIDLVGDQLGSDQFRRNRFKQKIPFNTVLKMEGELLKPELSFDIIIPDGNYNVDTDVINTTKSKLDQLRQQPSELNKQVFAVLLLNRFIGENPFSSEAGGTSTESLARQSVSKILSEQLNNLAANLVSGVQLNFDLESTDDYTTGQLQSRTDLNVGISKQLLNDRLKVTVGSSFGLEGPQQANEETTNIAGDVSLDYQLTPDGRYMVRAYRKNEYQVALQGQVVETGVGFIITMDYNKFRELFHRSKEEKEMLQRERERKQREKEEKKKQEEKEKTEAEADKLPPNSTENDK
ncbi:translocation/assembly module TamB [Flavobacterium sp. Sd200]|uniref:translocation/assembly module TamB domain-containing protein n=1 Tax=Flavobacterium sp. Sd200 TaxID=2692211 RepID=UPI00136BB52D|nr:translocation/assembly module TamB [Flavobacterium sp. Sd200]MXN89755.1 translocation/assembly module TamB [Flavobacterium sp. Sd200]